MNAEKLKKLQAEVRIGGKGTPRRKRKIVHSNPKTDDKKLQSSLMKISARLIPGIEEVNIIKNDGSLLHFNCPKVEAAVPANTFIITGHGENKFILTGLPDTLTQMGPQLQEIARELASRSSAVAGAADDKDDDDVPDLVDNFEEVAIGCGAAAAKLLAAESFEAAKKPEKVPRA